MARITVARGDGIGPGIKVWPDGFPETFCTDHWRCRFKNPKGGLMPKERIVNLLKAAEAHGIDVVKTENLYRFDGTPSYSLGQGQ
jgi:isocitrate dehydrogenase